MENVVDMHEDVGNRAAWAARMRQALEPQTVEVEIGAEVYTMLLAHGHLTLPATKEACATAFREWLADVVQRRRAVLKKAGIGE